MESSDRTAQWIPRHHDPRESQTPSHSWIPRNRTAAILCRESHWGQGCDVGKSAIRHGCEHVRSRARDSKSPLARVHRRRHPARGLEGPVAALLAAPLYLDGYAALPQVRALLDRGMAEGAAMAFLISGGIICVWTAVPVFALVRWPVFLAYIAMALAGSTLAGWGYANAVA